MVNSGTFLRVSYLNCHSLTKNRRYFINRFRQDNDIDLMIAAETWLKLRDPKPFNRTIFDLRQPNRPDKTRAYEGIAAGCSPKLHNRIQIIEQDINKKWCLMKIDLIIIATCYFNPPTTKNAIQFFWNRVEYHSNNATSPAIIMGDLNAHFEDDANQIQTNDRGNLITELIKNNNWARLEPSVGLYTTFTGGHQTITDHVIISPSAAPFVEDFYLEERPFDTDHLPLMVELCLPGKTFTPAFKRWNIRLLKEEKYVNHYRQLLDGKMQEIQNKIEESRRLTTEPGIQRMIDDIYEEFVKAINYAMENAIGYFESMERLDPFYHTKEIESLKEKLLMLKQQGISESDRHSTVPPEVRVELQDVKAKLKGLLRQASTKTFEKVAEEFSITKNTAKFLKMVHSLKNRESRSNCMLDPDKIGVHADYFRKSTFGLPPSGGITDREDLIHDMIQLARSFNDDRRISFEDSQLFHLISELPNDKAPGDDQIYNEMIKKAGSRTWSVIASLFRLILEKVSIPSSWKNALIVPVFKKKGDETKIENYRPIALTNSLRKLFEKTIMQHLKDHDDKLHYTQAGFRPHQSTVTQLDRIQTAKENNPDLILICLDIKAAYDTIDRRMLWKRLANHPNMNRHLIAVLQLLLNDNKSTLIVNGKSSRPIPNKRGVLQGSSISPIVFNWFLNDLLQTLSHTSEGIELEGKRFNHLAFADDIVLLCQDSDEASLLLKRAEKWAVDNGIQFSPSKCVTVSKIKISLSVHGTSIPCMNDSTYLGVPLNENGLNWPAHVEKRAAQSMKATFFMQSKGYYFNGWSSSSNVAAYKSFVRPVMEYAIQAIPEAISLKKLQQVQNVNLRIITGGDHATSIGAMHRVVNVTPVDFRRESLKAAKRGSLKKGTPN